MSKRITAFWQAIGMLAAAWLAMQFAFPPFLPRSLTVTYLFIVIIGLVLYFSSDDRLWEEFRLPIRNTLRNDNRAALRWIYLVAATVLVAWVSFDALRPRMDAPPELRQVHPAPPGTLNAFGKTYDLATLENPVRTRVLEQLAVNPAEAWATYRDAVAAGSEIFYRNCFYCHGDRLEADGHFAVGLDPLPTNFRDVGTIAQLQESYLFWRISKGGPGLPKDGMPWKSAMPAWEEMLHEQDIWNVITFLYDNVGQVPRMWNQEVSRAVSSMRDTVGTERQNMDAEALYRFRCAVCHGPDGMGDGPAADFVRPRPRDFTLGLYKYKTSAVDLPPRDVDLARTIREGLPGTSMPGWGTILSEQQINGLINYIKSLDIAGVWAPPEAPWEDFDDDGRYKKTDFRVIEDAERADGQVPYSAESVEAGRPIYAENCEKCHGARGRGNITSGTFLEDDWGYRIWPRDLTLPWTWRSSESGTGSPSSEAGADGRNETIRNIFTRVSVGIPGTPMPAHRSAQDGVEDAIPTEDRWHVANFVYSLRTGSVAPGEQSVIQAVEIAGALPSDPDSEAWSAAPGRSYRLTPNILKEDRLFLPVNQALTVRALYNEFEIALLLEVNDRTESIPGGAVMSFFASGDDRTMYSDALAVQFPKEGAYSSAPLDKPLFRHGDAAHGTTIWYWNAGSADPATDARAVLYDANGSDERLVPRAAPGALAASGRWQDGRWRVVMKRPRFSEDGSGDIEFPEGQLIPISFANWDGNNAEVGSRHTFTNWYWLLLPPETNLAALTGIPAGLAVATFLGGLALIRSQRRKPWPGNTSAAATRRN